MIAMIVAASLNDCIGMSGKIPWHLSCDLKRFKQITTGHTIIMGRKTYESIGRPLPNRRNIVISSTINPSVECKKSLPDALKVSTGDVFLIGGSKIYEEGISLCDHIFLTRVHVTVDGDTFIKNEWFKNFEVIQTEKTSENGIEIEFIDMKRVKNKSV